MKTYPLERVVRDKKGKLCIAPKFFDRGCYFYFVPYKFLGKISEGQIYLFKFGPPKYNGKKDKKGKRIYVCAAIPIIKE
jgi:hypothetical protein